MKRIFYPGKRVEAACYACGKEVMATYGYGTVQHPGDHDIQVPDIMRATCDTCGAILATAPQSEPLFRAAREASAQKRTQQTNVRIPRVMADYARMELSRKQAADVERFDLFLKAFALSVAGGSERRWQEAVRKLREARDPVLDLPCDYQLPLYLTERLRALLEHLQADAGLANLSELVRRVFVVMDSDKRADAELQKLVMVG